MDTTVEIPFTTISSSKSLDALAGKEVQRLHLTWDNLVVDVPVKKQTKRILFEVSGEARPGELLAIMGPSGGGKTTVLNCIAGRKKPTSGEVHLNGKRLPKSFNKLAAYVMQDDALPETLTPRELLMYSAQFRLPRSMPKQDKIQRVEYVLDLLNLKKCANTKVGGMFSRGLSGGERKRTAIGYELITSPSILFLDEPTSGLDSYSAKQLVDTLRVLAHLGHTVISTIHQPSAQTFLMFDKLLLLAAGKVAYSGTLSNVITHFEKIGYPCPQYENPADHVIGLLQSHEDNVDNVKAIVDKIDPKTLTERVDPINTEVKKPPKSDRPYWITEMYLLAQRSALMFYRNPTLFVARLMQSVVIAILAGIVFYQMDNNQKSISDRAGLLFYVVIAQLMTSIMSLVLTFPRTKVILMREMANGMYGLSAYYIGNFLSTVPVDLFVPLVFSVVLYFMTGLDYSQPEKFVIFYLIVVLIVQLGSAMGLFIGAVSPNAEVGVSVTPVALMPFILFGGFFAAISNIPAWISWVSYISPFRWAFYSFIVNEMQSLNFTCTSSELVQVPSPVPGLNLTVCPVTTGEKALDVLNVPNDLWNPIFILIGYIAIVRVLGYIGFWVSTYRARRAQ